MSDGREDVRRAVADALGTGVVESDELDGGEVGRVHRVALADGRTVVAKTGDTPLDVEAFMLAFLGDRGLPVPEVYHATDDLLVMEYVAGDGRLTPAAERDAARHLAALHEESPRAEDLPDGDGQNGLPDGDEQNESADGDGQNESADREESTRAYGFPRDTLSGAYRQPNPWTDSWVAFYRDHRLRFVAERAREEGVLSGELFDRLDALAGDLDAWLPASPPASLLHGDAWANNLVVANGTVRAFLDPACYFGHAEVELAYADFAGFGDAFFEAYETARAIDAGYEEGRREVYRLYPLLEHLRYFEDDRYAEAIARTLRAIGR